MLLEEPVSRKRPQRADGRAVLARLEIRAGWLDLPVIQPRFDKFRVLENAVRILARRGPPLVQVVDTVIAAYDERVLAFTGQIILRRTDGASSEFVDRRRS